MGVCCCLEICNSVVSIVAMGLKLGQSLIVILLSCPGRSSKIEKEYAVQLSLQKQYLCSKMKGDLRDHRFS